MQINNFVFRNLILLSALMLLGCSSSDNSFVGILYQLAEINEENRESFFQSWLEGQENLPVIENNSVYFIYQNEKDMQVFVTGDMNKWAKDKNQMLRIIGTSYYFLSKVIQIMP